MFDFKKIFPVDYTSIKGNVIISPIICPKIFAKHSGLTLEHYSKNFLYEVGQFEKFTLIKTLMGSGFVMDSVLCLEKTNCKRLYFIGSCGGLGNLKLGDLVVSTECYNYECLGEMLVDINKNVTISYPDKALVDDFVSFCKNEITKCSSASIGSLFIESKMEDIFDNLSVCAVDMELAGFFHASRYINRRALGFLYVSDLIFKKPYYEAFDNIDKSNVSLSKGRVIDLMSRYLNEK